LLPGDAATVLLQVRVHVKVFQQQQHQLEWSLLQLLHLAVLLLLPAELTAQLGVLWLVAAVVPAGQLRCQVGRRC
jgi:hypothetical protein